MKQTPFIYLGLVALTACSPAADPGSSNAANGGNTGGHAGNGGTAGGTAPTGGGAATGAVSPSGGNGGTLIMDDAGNGGENCGRSTFDLELKPAKLLLLLDRSASMQDPPDGSGTSDAKWDLVVPAVNQVITETDATVSWGLKVFPEGDGAECVEGSVTDHVDVPIAPMNAATVTAAVTSTPPEGNGTPTGDAVTAAAAYLQALTGAGDGDRKYILLATDGEPSCAGTEEGQAEARPYAVAALTAAAEMGFHTFVVGVSTTKETATKALNDMAIAGGEARPDPNPLATKFYLANTRDELTAALQVITGVVSDCRFDLSSPPPEPNHVGVHVGDDLIPDDAWRYTDSAMTGIEVTGAWCDTIKASAGEAVEIVFGCKNDPVY